MVGGDSFDVKIEVDPNAKVLVTTPAAGKFYRSAGDEAYQQQIITVADHGVLEWFPSENIFFPGAKVKLETRGLIQGKPFYRLGYSVFGQTCDWRDFFSR